MKKSLRGIAAGMVGLMMMASFTGCSSTMNAIENRNLNVQAKMSDTVFLDVNVLAKNRKVYVRTTNTSDFQEIDMQRILGQKLAGYGLELVPAPVDDGYVVQANLLYMGEQKGGMNMDSVLAGGFGGALIGTALASHNVGNSYSSMAGYGLAGALVGAAAGAAMDSMVHVDEYIGAMDVQIQEPVKGGVTGTQSADLKNGSSTVTKTVRNVESNKQEYRTRIAVWAKQTNMNKIEASGVLADKIATQIAASFKL